MWIDGWTCVKQITSTKTLFQFSVHFVILPLMNFSQLLLLLPGDPLHLQPQPRSNFWHFHLHPAVLFLCQHQPVGKLLPDHLRQAAALIRQLVPGLKRQVQEQSVLFLYGVDIWVDFNVFRDWLLTWVMSLVSCSLCLSSALSLISSSSISICCFLSSCCFSTADLSERSSSLSSDSYLSLTRFTLWIVSISG